MRLVMMVLAALILLPQALAQTAAPQPTTAPPETVTVRMETSAGPIVLALDATRAPRTTANFLRYVDQKRFDGTAFYRALKVAGSPDLGFIQGGTRNDPKRILPPVVHEPTTQTGLSHQAGTISMARYEPGSANGDFFITLGAMPSMDAQTSGEGDIAGFAAFGQVVEGMDVVRRILAAPTSPTEGEGVMKGQMLSPVVTILTARRLNAPLD
ncbi:peptidylprolyl isomerase [Sphingobium algorifonticola]|uniref:peptidylprolyl isomerase n=1 Tax=Sphingobium algorifonticola TaxID=2008318 RepID=A0A437JB45_9SPHN|nr:peptidylprolyl isomerase [Sphingobium algorifonticola]RVT43104.1 peptidylprolyl isomerase [Sphingobium algorifonticola]